MKPRILSTARLSFPLATAIAALLAAPSVHAASGDWNVDNSGDWSLAANWNPVAVPGTSNGDTIGLTNNITTGTRTVTIDTASRIAGILNIGDSDNTHSFTLAASGGGFLTLNNNGTSAQINETGSVLDTLSTNITLADNLAVSAAGSLTLSGIVSQSGGAKSITKSGTGTLTLSGANTYTGATDISGGILILNNAAALGGNTPGVNGTSAITMATGTTLRTPLINGAVTVFAPITTSGNVTINGPTVANGAQTFNEFILNGAIGGTGNVTFNNTNNINQIFTVTLGAVSDYSGTTTITNTAGTAGQMYVKLGVTNALPTTTILDIRGLAGTGTGRGIELNLFGFSQTLAGLTNSAAAARVQRVVNSNASAAATLTINGSTDTTFTGFLGTNSPNFSVAATVIPGSTNGNNFGLTKNGTGTFTIDPVTLVAGASTYTGNTYTGGTTISQGKLIAQGIQTALGATAGAVSVAASGTLQINQNNATPDTTFAVGNVITGAGTLEFTASAAPATSARRLTSVGALTGFTGNISILANGNYLVDTTNDTTNQNLTIATGGYLTISTTLNAGFGTLNGAGIIMRNGGGATTSTLTLGNNNATGGVFSGTIRGESTTASSGLFGSSGLIAVTKVGTGTQTLSGTNIYTGTTTISGGTLILGNAGGNTLADTGAVVIGDVAGATLQLDFNETIGSLAGGGTTGGAVNLQGNALTVGNANSTTFAGTMGGTSGSLTKQGAGTRTLSGTNTYTGGSTVTAGGIVFLNLAAKAPGLGTHAFGAGTTLGLGVGGAGFFSSADVDNAFSGTMTGNLSNVTVTPTTNVGVDTSAGNFIFGASVAGSPTKGLVKLGANDLTLSGANTFTGSTTVIAGTLTLANALALQNSPLVTTGGAGSVVLSAVTTPTLGGLSGATGDLATLISGYSGVTALTLNTPAGVSLNYGGNIIDGAPSMTLTKTGAGIQALSGTNTYTGATQINGGILVFRNKASKAGATATAAAAGSIGLGVKDADAAFYSAAEVGDLFNTNSLGGFNLDAASGVAIDTTAASFDQTVALTATRSLTKLGGNTLTLSTANSYNGGTSITAGLISVTNANALGTNTVTFNGGTRLSVAGGLTVANNIIIGTNSGGSGRGLLESSGTGTATLGGNITINSGATAGGHFASTTGNDLVLSGVITSSVNVTQRIGTVTFSGGGTGYTNLDVTGSAKVGALNGIATTATVNIGVSSAGTLDLNGVNQSLVGITKGTNAATIGSSSTTADSVLTTTGTSSYGGTIVNVLPSSGGTRTVALTVASGALTLTGNNTYTGATTVTNGTLAIATGYLSLTTPINVASGAFLTTSRNNTFSGGGAGQPSGVWTIAGTITQTASGSTMPASVTLNNGTMSGGLAPAFGAFLAVGSGTTITANGATNTIDAGNLGLFAGLTVNTPLGTDALAISSQLGGTSALGGGLTKNGLGTVTLSGINTYTGDTTVNAGVLAVVGTSIADTNKLVIAGGKVNLTGTETVNTLFFGGVQQAAGNYTSADPSTNFTGGGTLTVLTGPPAGYSAWAALNGASLTNLSEDHDSDGVDNGTEYFIGGPTGNTTGFTPLPGVTNTAGVLSVTWTKSANYTGIYGTDFSVETSATLTGVWATEPSPGTVAISATNVTYTFPAGTINFARLKVTGP